jgi:peptidoglycan hydrolase-like protein with peptidoglycan-binding domain
MVVPFAAAKHPRGAGGLFAASAAANGKPTGAWAKGPVQSGSAHGNTADPRAKSIQQALNKLGITDEHGKPLLVDGKPGAHTSAAIKKWQSAHGMKPTGSLDAKAVVALLSAKPAAKKSPPKASARRTATRKPAGRKLPTKKPGGKKPPAKKAPYTGPAASHPKAGSSRLGVDRG